MLETNDCHPSLFHVKFNLDVKCKWKHFQHVITPFICCKIPSKFEFYLQLHEYWQKPVGYEFQLLPVKRCGKREKFLHYEKPQLRNLQTQTKQKLLCAQRKCIQQNKTVRTARPDADGCIKLKSKLNYAESETT